MAMQVDHSSGGFGPFGAQPLEPPEPDFAPPVPPPAPPPSPPAPSNWVAELPPAVFGPPAPHPGDTPAATVLATLAPPPAVAIVEAPVVAPVAAPVVASMPAAATAATAPTASAMEIATLELTLADPLTQELIHHHGGALPVLDLANLNPVLQEQVDRYGASLTARLMQLAQANAAVRDLYLQAMQQAAQDVGPETPGAVFVPGTQGNRGDSVPDTWRFDPVAFTQAYAQAGLNATAPVEQRAFAAFYGPDALQAWERSQGGGRGADNTLRGYTLGGSFELSVPALTDQEGSLIQGELNWAGAILESDSHGMHTLSLQAPPELHNAQAVWFDATLGWVTTTENMVVKQSFADKALPFVVAIAAAWAVGPYAAQLGASAGLATGSTFVAGAVQAGVMAAASSTAMQIASTGTLDFRQLVKTTLSGALTGGLLQGLGIAQHLSNASFATRVMAMTGQATVQGAVQEVMGGRFRDGFTSGMASGLANEITQALSAGLSQAGLTPAQQSVASVLTRATGSAIRALAGDDDVQRAIAMDFLSDLVEGGLDEAQAWAGTRDQSAAESARLARQNDVSLGQRGGDAAANPQPDDGAPVSSPSTTPSVDASGSPVTQIVIITGNRPEGTAVEVTLPAGADAAADITRNGTPTELLSGSAATAALALLGVSSTAVEAAATAGGRLMLYAGERAVGLMVPGVGLLLGASTAAYYVIHSGSQHAPGDAFEGADGSLQRYAPASDGGLDLQSWSPQAAGSPEEVEGTWTTVGRFVPLSDTERAEMLRPTTTPAQPQPPQSPPPLPASHESSQPLPGYTPEGVQQPTVIGTPAAPQPTWEDLVIEASNSEKLGQNMRDVGRTPPLDSDGNELPGYIPHHMLPSEKWAELDPLRDRFAAWNIDLNSADNGVWLPGYRSPTDALGSYHESLHNGDYRDAFRDAFRGVTTREEAVSVLADIRSQLQEGSFPGSRPRRP